MEVASPWRTVLASETAAGRMCVVRRSGGLDMVEERVSIKKFGARLRCGSGEAVPRHCM